MSASTASLDAFIRALPKTETHLHLDGSLPYELLHAWQPETYPPQPYFHAADFRFPSFPKFDEILLGHALPWFTSPERYYESARLTFAKHVVANVRYVECSFHLAVAHFINVPVREIVAAIHAAVPPGLTVKLYAGMLRSDYAGPMRALIDDLVNQDGIAGADIHGYEPVPTEAWTGPVWARLRAAGKVTKCHAGEFDGAHRVREAIEQLGVTRVQHGIRAIDDPAVMALAVERGVTFDTTPISNVRLQVVTGLDAHPLRALMAAGINCTVSTDDQLVFNNTILDEYRALAIEGGFTRAELARVAANGWRVA
ncbi:MAG: adenosine deaminase, partial [Burkholderiales bacterium]|nr:adenosine deaminase [Opitutaceae bacterium]